MKAVVLKDMLSHGLLLLALLATAVILSGCGQADHFERIEAHKRMAGELINNSLYQAAIDEYTALLVYDDLNDRQRANINYLMARTYYEHVKDYRRAAAHYIKARAYDPEASFAAEATKKLVASLEKIGNVLDARRQLGAAANLGQQSSGSDDRVVARIGDRKIWLSEVEAQIELLPVELQSQLSSPQARIDYVHQYVGVELLYNAAVREDYLADQNIARQQEQLVKRFLVDRFVSEKILPGVRIDSLDVRTYYEANRDKLYKNAAFDSVRSQVWRDYQSQKAEAAYGEYIMKLAKIERVEFLDKNVK